MEVSVYAAKTHLSRLLDRAAKGEEIVITRNRRPVAKLVPLGTVRGARKLGILRGKLRVGKDFESSLPEEVLAAFEGET